jgi:hypothetical protein
MKNLIKTLDKLIIIVYNKFVKTCKNKIQQEEYNLWQAKNPLRAKLK